MSKASAVRHREKRRASHDDRASEVYAMRRNGALWTEIAERFGISTFQAMRLVRSGENEIACAGEGVKANQSAQA
jgi:transposase